MNVTGGNHSWMNGSIPNNDAEQQLYNDLTLSFSILMVLIATVGILGNGLSVFVYTRICMRSSINVLLAGLSVCDGICCALGGLVFTVPGFYVYTGATIFSTIIAYMTVFVYPIALMAQTASVWSLVVITVERYIAVTYPLRARHWLTITRSRGAMLATIATSIAYNAVRFLEYRLSNTPPWFEENLKNNETYKRVYRHWMYLILMFILPFAVLVVMNACIVRVIKFAQRNRATLSTQQSSEHKTSKMMLTVILIFLICNTFPLVLNLLETMIPFNVLARSPWFFVIIDIGNTLVIGNSAGNFIVYLIFSAKYRSVAAVILTRVLNTAKGEAQMNDVFETIVVPGSMMPSKGSTFHNTITKPGKPVRKAAYTKSMVGKKGRYWEMKPFSSGTFELGNSNGALTSQESMLSPVVNGIDRSHSLYVSSPKQSMVTDHTTSNACNGGRSEIREEYGQLVNNDANEQLAVSSRPLLDPEPLQLESSINETDSQ